MRIVAVKLRNFRCFSSLDLDFDSSTVLIHGPNGSGKTSLLEALHYACYLRSFKTHLPREIVQAKAEGFGVELGILSSQGFDTLHLNFNRNKRAVKLNEQAISSYKDLYNAYKVVTITEDDLMMVQGAPSLRRSFLDHMALLINPEYVMLGKKYRAILENRNALLHMQKNDDESYVLWTEHLLQVSLRMQEERKKMIALLEIEVQKLITHLSWDVQLTMAYEYAKPYTAMAEITNAEELLLRYPALKGNEAHMKRTLFGAHLDDFSLLFQGKAARSYASRGQQKLIVFLLKLAKIACMQANTMPGAILLVDDFMTDFDEVRAEALIPLMTSLPSQVIITSPLEGLVKERLKSNEAHIIDLKKISPRKAHSSHHELGTP